MAGLIKVGRLLSGGGGAFTVAPPDVEQDTGNQTSTAATSDTATFGNATVSGRGIIVCFALKGGRRVATLTDNKGNTYVQVGYAVDESDAVAEMWYAQSITGGASHTLTVTYDAAANCVWGAIEVSRIKGGGGFLDAQAVRTNVRNNVGSSASVAVTSGTPRATNELFVAMLSLAGGGADAGIDTPSLWTAITQFNNFDGVHAGNGAYRVNGNATALTATWTNDTTDAPAAMIIAPFRAQNAISAGVSAPVNSVAPAITGTPTEGETLTASTGTWSNSPDSYTYQWKDDGVAISGATASTYVLTSSEIGATITVTVTAHNEGSGSSGVSATSAGVGPVAAASNTPQPTFSNVTVLLGFEGADAATTTTDESPTTPNTFTFVGNAQIDTAQFKFGASSLLLDGNGDYINSASAAADVTFGTQFMVEAWIRLNATGTQQSICGAWPGSAGQTGWDFLVTSGNKVAFQTRLSPTTTETAGATSLTTGVWYHVAATRDGSNVIRIFLNGVMDGSSTNNFAFSTNNQFEIGFRRAVGFPFNGWIDELRIVKGENVYNSDAGFDVPIAAHPRS